MTTARALQPAEIAALPPTCAFAAVARSSRTEPDFAVADAATQLVAARWRQRAVSLSEPGRLDDHLLSFCVRGGAHSTLALDGVPMRAQEQAGAVTFVPAGRAVQWQLEAPGEMDHVHLYIADDALRAQGRDILGLDDPVLAGLMNVREPWLESFFGLLIAEYEFCRSERRLDSFDFLQRTGDLLVRRVVALQAQRMAARPRPSRVSPLRPLVLRRIEQHVDEHLAGDIRLEHLAGLAAMSVDHFVRAFQQATGTTPHRYLLQRRLDRACGLLRESTEHVAEVAHRCGFTGAAHFSATFHQHHGMTPTAYRRGA